MANKDTGIYILIGSLISATIVGYFLRKQQEKQRKEDEELVKTTTEQVMRAAFPDRKLNTD